MTTNLEPSGTHTDSFVNLEIASHIAGVVLWVGAALVTGLMLAVRDKIFITAVYCLLRKFNSPPNSTWAGSILTSAGLAWDLGVQLMEHEGEDQCLQKWELTDRRSGV